MTDNKYLEEMLESLERRLFLVVNHNSARQRDYEAKFERLHGNVHNRTRQRDYEHKVDRLHSNVKIACNSIEKRLEKLEENEARNIYLCDTVDKAKERIEKLEKHTNGYDNRDNKIIAKVLKKLADLDDRVDDLEDSWEDE